MSLSHTRHPATVERAASQIIKRDSKLPAFNRRFRPPVHSGEAVEVVTSSKLYEIVERAACISVVYWCRVEQSLVDRLLTIY